MTTELLEKTEQRLIIPGPAGDLDTVVNVDVKQSFKGIALVAHPHPLHGGNMDNKVIFTLARCFRQRGVMAVRFNFRGVGRSGGGYDQGRGEQDDVVAVANWLYDWMEKHALVGNFYLAGFSFGAAMAARVCHKVQPDHLTLVAPPVERYHLQQIQRFPCPLCLIQGEDDKVVSVDSVRRWSENIATDYNLITLPYTDHFFHGRLLELKDSLGLELDRLPSSR
jgi:alpha/beta superfamily hydrolase